MAGCDFMCVRVALRIIVQTALPKEGDIAASQDYAQLIADQVW